MSSVTEKYGTNLLNPLATNTNKADYKINELNTAINNFQKNASVTNDAAIIADLSVDVANKLENAKNYISDDVYKNIQNQLISYRSASNQQRINQEIRQNLIEKNKAARESAADRIGSIVKNKMVTDTATALDLLELQQLEQQGVKADSTVVSDVQKHLLGQETSEPIYTQSSLFESFVEEIESKYNLPKNPKNAEAPLDWVDQLLPNLREDMESLEYLEKNGGLTEEEKKWYNEVKQQIADFETYKKIKPVYETKKEAKLLSYDISSLSYEDRLIEYENALKSGDELYAGYIDEHKYDGLSYDKLLEIEEQLKEKATPVYDYVDIDEATDALGPLIAQKNKYDELINRGIDLGEQQEYYDDIVRQISEIEKFIEAYNAGEVVDVEAANKELKSFQRDVLYYAKHEHELDTLGDIGDDFIEAIKENQDAKNFKVRFSSHDKIEEIKKEIIDSGIMTKEEVNNLKYYIKSQYQAEKNKSEMEDVFADVSQYNDLQEIGMTLWSVPNTFGGNILSLFDSLYQVTREFFGGEVRPVNPYSDINASAQYAKTIREAVMADQSDTEKFFYGIGCSLLDMGASIAASGGIGDSLTKSITGKAVAGSLTKNATLASMSLSAGGGSAIDAMEKTSNPYEVAAVGVSAAVFEPLSEKLTLDNLFEIAGQSGKITSSMILKAMGSQAASEFGEEAATETANIIMEAVALNDKSDWSQTVQYYIDEGYSESEARGKALVSMIGRVGMSGLAGAISGGVTGGGASTINYLSYNYSLNSTGNTLIKNNQVERLIELAETSGIDISAYNLDGKKGNYNAKAVGELYFELMRNKSDAVSNALKEMGVSEADISIVQSAMLRESAGQPLSSEMQAKYSQYEDVIKHSFEDESSNLSVAANDYLLTSLLVDIARPKAPNNSTDVSETDSADVDFDTNIDGDIDTDVNVESSSDIDTATESEIAEADYLDNETLESVEENEYDKTIRLMDGRAKPLTEAQAYVQSVGRALGYTVVIDDLSRGGRTASGKSFKGTTRGFFDGQTIYLHEGHTTFEAVVEIFKHEITHYSELNPKMYEKYADAVFNSKVFENWISEQKVDGEKVKGRSHPARLGQYRQSIIDIYEANGKTLDPTAADREIIANFTSEMLFNEKGNTLERFINEVNGEDRNAISRFIHDFISWLKARLKGEKVSYKIIELENRFAAVLRNVDNANAQKNNTTNDGDVQYSNYWYPNMSKADLEYVKRRAKYELNTTENYVDNITKWLYNDKNGKQYFALYSTEDANNPTILYACNSNRADFEHQFLYEHLIKEVDGSERVDRRAEIINRILGNYGDGIGKKNVNNRNTVERGSDSGNAAVYRRNSRNRPSEALLNCLRNIAKISDTDGADLNERSAFSMPENDNEVSYSFEITPEQDTAYMDAVNNGDMETAQRLVDEAAKEAGYTVKGLHATNAEFTVFDIDKTSENNFHGKGIYFTNSVRDVENNYENYEGPDPWQKIEGRAYELAYDKYGISYEDTLTSDSEIIDKLNECYDIAIEEFNKSGRRITAYLRFDNPLILEKGMQIPNDYSGYDGIIDKQVYENIGHSGMDENTIHYVVFNPNNIKSADAITYDDNGDVIPLSERFNEDDNDIRYSFEDDVVDKTSSLAERVRLGEISQTEYLNELQSLMNEATEKYGAIPKGENPKVDVTVPKQVSDKRNTRRFVRTVLESGTLTDEMVADTDEAILKDALSYVPISNEEAIKVAANSLINGTAERDWNKIANGDKIPSKHDIAKGEMLLKMYAENGDTLKVMELVADLSEVATRAGQTVQAFSLLKKMSGVGQLYYIQKTVDKLNRDLEKKHKGKHEQITIDETLAGQLVTAKPGTEAENIADEIMQDIAEQVPVTFLDKWNAWRYLAMLGNPRTHIRNLLGNAVFMPAIKLKDTIKAGMEKAFVSQENRTTSVIVNKEYKDFAESDFEKVVDIITGNGKMNPSDTIREQQKIFKNKVFEGFRKFNFDMLKKEDMVFLKMHYKRALGGFLQARNIDLNNVDEATLNEARNYAIKEAQKATYRDGSVFANTISRFSKSNKVANVLVEGVLPFKKTPINIIKRGVEYSPIGILKALTKDVYDLKKNKINLSEYLDRVSASLTGTGIFALGMFLSYLGVAIGGLGYDDEDALKRLNGEQEYSIELFGHSYTVDWMAPVCIPFFMGVECYNMFSESDKEWIWAVGDSFYAALEPMINLSMLSGIRDTISAARYSDAEDVLTQIGGEIITSYFSQALPTLFGQVARTRDDTRRSNFVPGDATGFEKKLYEFTQNAMGKIPILENEKMPYTNAFGDKDTNDSFFFRLLENMMSPGYASTIKETDVNAELADLFGQTGDSSVIPQKAPKSFNVNGERIYLNADEYTQYNTKKGQLSQNMLVDLFNSKGYKSMTYTKKAEAVSEIYKYANMLAKTEVSDYQLEGKYAKWKEYQGYGYDVSELIALDIADKDFDGSGGVSKSEYAEAVNNTDMSQKQKDLLIGLNDVEGKSDYSKNKTKGFGAGDWYYKKNGQYIKIASAAELNQLRRNNVDTYVYTGNYTDVIDELWRAYRGY